MERRVVIERQTQRRSGVGFYCTSQYSRPNLEPVPNLSCLRHHCSILGSSDRSPTKQLQVMTDGRSPWMAPEQLYSLAETDPASRA